MLRIWCTIFWLLVILTHDRFQMSFTTTKLWLLSNYLILALIHTILCNLFTTFRLKWKQRNIGFITVLKKMTCLAIWKMKRLSSLGELVSREDKLCWLSTLSINDIVRVTTTSVHLNVIPRLATQVIVQWEVTIKGATAKGKQGGGSNLTWHVLSRQSALPARLLLQQLWEDGVCSLGGEDLRLKT